MLNGMKFPVLLHCNYISTVHKVGHKCSYQNYDPLNLSDRVFSGFSAEENRVSIQGSERR